MSSGVIYLLLRELQTGLINSGIIPFVKNAIPYQTKGLGKKVMLTLYQIALAPERKPSRIVLLFTDKYGDFGANSLTERSCLEPIPKVERHTLYTSCATRCGQVLEPSRKWISRIEDWNPLRRKRMFGSEDWDLVHQTLSANLLSPFCAAAVHTIPDVFLVCTKTYPVLCEHNPILWQVIYCPICFNSSRVKVQINCYLSSVITHPMPLS